MDYPYYNQPYNMYGLPAPSQNNHHGEDLQNSYNSLNYQSFDPSFQPTAPSFGPPPQSPPESYSKHSVSSNEPLNGHFYPGSIEGRDDLTADPRSSSEEKDSVMTPAQSKRKAQNRAAQRAFRERKERHVRELEEKVTNLEQESSTLIADNERLKRELARYSTENEILRATNSLGSGGGAGGGAGSHPRHSEVTTTGPMTYSPTDFYSNIVPKGQAIRLHRVTYCKKTGERLLDAGATWDLIQRNELCKRGLVDIADVTERLKGMAQCDGQGPAFRESQVRRAIEESAAMDNDELI